MWMRKIRKYLKELDRTPPSAVVSLISRSY